jgi:DNA-binding response OmpR family regulator
MKGKRILIVDDEPAVCKVIALVLAGKGMSPQVAHSGSEALAFMKREEFDAVVLDITMDEMDGFEVLAKIRETNLDVPVVILSANNENYSMLLGLESGADDYMTKPFDPTFLAAKIQALLRRENRKRPDSSALRVDGLSYDASARRLSRNGEEISLSAKEHALVRLFMENQGRVFSKEELYSLIWCDGKTPVRNDDNTVMVHINRLRGKIEPDPKDPRYIMTVWGVGYRMGGGA